MPSVLSPHLHLIENHAHEIVLGWDAVEGQTPQGLHRALIFAHGPIESATYAIDAYEWIQEAHDESKGGAQEDFSIYFSSAHSPRLELRLIGTLLGSRIVVVTLRLGDPQHNQGIRFPRGTIRIRFTEIDVDPSKPFHDDLAAVAERLCLNYPPLRAAPADAPVPDRAPYSDRAALKITSREAGVLEAPALLALEALGSVVQIQELALYQQVRPAPLLVLDPEHRVKQVGALEPQDRIVLFSPASDSPYSPDSVSWLVRDASAHRFMAPLDPIHGESTGHLSKRIQLEEDLHFIYGRDTDEFQSEFWMWSEISSSATHAVSVPMQDWIAGASAVFKARLVVDPSHIGISASDIQVETPQGAVELTSIALDQGRLEVVGEITLPSPRVETLDLVLSTTDPERLLSRNAKLYLDWIELTAPAEAQASLAPYRASGSEVVELPEDAAYTLWIHAEDRFDVRYATAGDAAYMVPATGDLYFQPIDGQIHAAVVEERDPDSIAARSLFQPTQADVLIIAPWEWRNALQNYVNSLERVGYRARIVAVEAVYDIFGDGRLSPHAIRDYLRYVYSTQADAAPAYVLLVGDATWDYWGRYRNEVVNIVPGYRGHPDYAVENWFVRLHNLSDPIPDMMIGRWPVRTQDELVSLIQKSIHYKERLEPGEWLNHILLTTDDGFDSYMNEIDERLLPSEFRRIRRHIRDYPLIDNVYLPSQMRQALKAKTSLEATQETVELLNQGQFLWLFFGHGAPNVIGNERIFFGGGSVFSDVRKLTHMEHPFILWAFSCETCRFDFPRERWNISIGEDLLTHLDGGSVALVGATGRGFPHDHISLARGLLKAAFHWNLPTLGQQMLAAGVLGLAQQRNFEPIDQFALLGDPTLAMPQWKRLESEEIVFQEESQQVKARWRLPESPQQKLSARVWAQGDRDVLFSREITISPLQDEVHVVLPFGEDERERWRSIGIDAVETNLGRATVWQGAAAIPPAPAPPVILPSTGRLPNLSFVEGSLRFEPQMPRDGQTVFIHAEVENRGAATAERIRLSGVIVDQDGQEEIMRVTVGDQGAEINRLDPGERAPAVIRWDPVANAGEHNVALRIDPMDRIAQEDDEAALRYWETSLWILRKADLAIYDASASINPHPTRQEYVLEFAVVNEGESPVDNVVVQLVAHLEGQDTPATLRLSETYSLQPGERQVFGGIGLPPALEAIEIVIDPDEILDEESHENNRIRLTPPAPSEHSW